MELTDSRDIAADRQTVWNALLDPPPPKHQRRAEFKYANRTIPYDGTGICQHRSQLFCCFRANIKNHVIIGNCVYCFCFSCCFGTEFFACYNIHR